MHDTLRFWFERGIDGFRIDVLNLLAKDQELRAAAHRRGGPIRGHGEQIADRIRELRRVADEFDGRVLIGEIWLPIRKLVDYYGVDLTGVHLPFNFQLLTLPWSARRIRRAIWRYERLLPDGAWPNWVLSNHDKPRIASRVGAEQARVAATLLLTLRGTPTIYYGDEIGMTDVAVPREQQRDPQGLRGGESRDPQRTPMRWDRSSNSGFTVGNPWLPIGPNNAVNVDAQRDERRSMLNLYRSLIALRRREPALTVGSLRLLKSNADVIAYERAVAGRRLVVALNLSPFEVTDAIGGESAGRILFSTRLDRHADPLAAPCPLLPNEGIVVELED
jgi:alpha-glucosidase